MRILKAMVVLAATAACAAAQGQRPLEASLRRGAIEALFSVDEPAYVAVFEAIPGRGIQQIFPRSTMQASRPVDPGEYLLSRQFRSYSSFGWEFARPYARPMWMLDARGGIAGYYYATGWSGPYAARAQMMYAPTRTLLMVASRFPLRLVGGPEAAQHWLQRVVGFRELTFSVAPAQSTFDDIVAAIVPTGAGYDDVVVDVLDLIAENDAWNALAAQSITFRCPGGVMYSMSAQFYFATGDFWCPAPRIAVNGAPVTPIPPQVVVPPVEGIRGFRRVPTKTDVASPEEEVRALPRGVRSAPATLSVQSPVEEGARMYNGRRVGGAGDDGPRAFGRGADLPTHASVLIGDAPHVEGIRSRGVGTVISAYVPPGAPGASEGYGGRVVPDGRSGGNTPYGGGMHAGGTLAGSSGASVGASSVGAGNSYASPAASASAAQAARSAESRAAVNAARPTATGSVPPQL